MTTREHHPTAVEQAEQHLAHMQNADLITGRPMELLAQARWEGIVNGLLLTAGMVLAAVAFYYRAVPAGSGACFWLLVAVAGVAAFAVGWAVGLALK